MSNLAYYEKLAENGTSLTAEVFNWMMGLSEDDVIAKTYVALSVPAANAYGQGQYDRRQEEARRQEEEARRQEEEARRQEEKARRQDEKARLGATQS
ncbi:hypothetical protein K7432_014439 [Basidiobolus ranarum]|uniref:Uncharacterized protein n=1 Tax=Basidiobolus ranarum TaxID=34480 RepID=A0ABR2VPH5_9FUNG